MIALLGRLGTGLALAASLALALDQAVAWRRDRRGHARGLALLALGGVALAVGALETALITHDFSLAYVAANNATVTPLLYSVTGLWSALEGSLLLWVLLLDALVVAVVLANASRARDDVVRVATGVLGLVSAFFTYLLVLPADPFLTSPVALRQGAGPNALLQDNPLVAIHPPLLYLGFVGFAVPFAFAIGQLATGRVGEDWLRRQRRFAVLAWGSLSVGIVLGAWWSYQVLGWGGFWGWDPVENAALLPWLTGTAYLHSTIVQDRRGLLRVWNLALAIATFALTVLATFFTRSGVLQSVHAFSSSTLGPLLIGLFALAAGGGAALLVARGDRLRSPVGVDHPLSREGLFLLNNVLFVGVALVVLLGTVFPLLYQAVNGVAVTVGTPYFAAVVAPAAIATLALMAIAPLVPWRQHAPRVLWERVRLAAWTGLALDAVLVGLGVRRWRDLLAYLLAVVAAGAALRGLRGAWSAARRRGAAWRMLRAPSTGGMVTHLGVVVLAVGIVTSTSYAQRTEVALRPGQRTLVDGQLVGYHGLRQVRTALASATQLVVSVDGATLHPAVTTYVGRASQPVGTPAIDSNLLRDVYVTFDAIGGSGATSGAQVAGTLPPGAVALGVTVEPLLSWLWIGGLLIGLGSAVALVRRHHGEAA